MSLSPGVTQVSPLPPRMVPGAVPVPPVCHPPSHPWLSPRCPLSLWAVPKVVSCWVSPVCLLPLQGVPEVSLVPLACPRGVLGIPWGFLGDPWGFLGGPWGVLGVPRGKFGEVLGDFEAFSAPQILLSFKDLLGPDPRAPVGARNAHLDPKMRSWTPKSYKAPHKA